MPARILLVFALAIATLACNADGGATTSDYELVLQGGRVIDPDSGLDAIRNIGITGGRIGIISKAPLNGKKLVNVTGLVVAPGFIDLHAHGQDNKANALQVLDGVTTSLELEIGALPITQTYAARSGKSILNYGYTASHLQARTRVLLDKQADSLADIAAKESANSEQLKRILDELEQGLREGALGIGMGLEYSPGAGRVETNHIFALAARYGAPVFVHPRRGLENDPAPESAMQQVQELIANAAATGAALHICHITSTALQETAEVLALIDGSNANGVDVSTEAYPYDAASTYLKSAMFEPGWRKRLGGIDYSDIVWVATGEQLTEKTFHQYRNQPGPGMVIIHSIPETAMNLAISHPETIIASDGMPWRTGLEHPRGAGSFARVLGRFVRERGMLDLNTALAKMTILPARRLEKLTPSMRLKGRIQAGADADITVFNPDTVIDRATYKNPMQPSTGIVYVLVNGVIVVSNGQLQQGVYPGQAILGTVTE